MIQIKVKRNPKKDIVSISVSGHAGSGPYGHDLVCAAVSAIITGGANAISNQSDFDIKINSGFAKIELKNDKFLTNEDGQVLKTIYIQFLTIEKSYGKFIKIKNL